MRIQLPSLLLFLSLPVTGMGGDILRGGAGPNQTPNGLRPQSNTAGQVTARSNASDAMARTAQAISAAQNMQAAARQAAQQAVQRGVKTLVGDPMHPVTDGMGSNGLQVAPGATPGTELWSGASAPSQSVVGSGRVNVKIKQNQQQALLTWKTFNVGGNTTLTFDQSDGGANAGKWIAYNKVNDPTGQPSQIIGSIQAQGQVYVINGNGIIFGGASQVNVHTLVASALPINDVLVKNGVLNNPTSQFLFNGVGGTAPNGKWGDVTVQAGAQIVSPANASNVGGRVALIGANVTNNGTISTPDGQTILAAGLQVGLAAHKSSDASLRGLDVYVGAVADPASSLAPYAGTVTNTGTIESLRGSAYLTGKTITHSGVIQSSTSVSLNGRVDIDASYDAVANTAYKPTERPDDAPFLFHKTGTVELGSGSVIQILPHYSDTAKVAGTELALNSTVNIRGLTAHLGKGATILAPSGTVNMNAGTWDAVQTASQGTNRFVRSAGQIYLDNDALINVAGTVDASAQLNDYLLTLQLRGGELAGSPLQRDSIFRNALGTGTSITVDLRRSGIYNGFRWVGTPLADLSGYLGLIQRTVSELTTSGGRVNLNAGSSVVMQPGSKIDVSAGWVNFSGGEVTTSRVVVGGHLYDIADAPPDRIYSSVYTGQFTETHPRWGVSKTYQVPWMTGQHYEQPYFDGAAGGAVQIAAAGVALDGTLLGQTIAGPRQQRSGTNGSQSSLPEQSEFNLSLTQEQFLTGIYPVISPSPADVIFQYGTQQAANAFHLDTSGNPDALRSDRLAKVYLSPDLFTTSGFSKVSVDNPDGHILIPADVTLHTQVEGGLTLKGANIDILGNVVTPGGTFSATAYNISPSVAAANLRDPAALPPAPNTNRGTFTLGSGATINTAGLLLDDRFSNPDAFSQPVVTQGGSVNIDAFNAKLNAGSLMDVSGGARIDPWGAITYGNGGSINIKAGQDTNLKVVTGGRLDMKGDLLGRSGAEGGTLNLQAQLIQVGGLALTANTLLLQPDFFSRGGFGTYSLTGLGQSTRTASKFAPGVYIAPGTVIEPVAESYVVVPHHGPDGGLSIRTVQKPEGERSPVNLSFTASGVEGKDGLVIRGDLVFGEGATLRVDPLGEVSLKGQTAAILGSVYAPGGTIHISGGKNSFPLLFTDQDHALTTVYIGSHSVLSTAGTTVLRADAYGRRIGEVLPGGQISVTGNIVAAAGAVLDVSGTSDELDFHPTALDASQNYVVPATSGLTTPLYHLLSQRTRIDSNGGSIELTGGQMLFVDATLRGFAGGPSAEGGTLSVGSGRFYAPNVIPPATDSNLVVTQSGPTITTPLPNDSSAIGRGFNGVIGRGYFAADTFTRGGFDSLDLKGVVEFKGPVSIQAGSMLRIADGGIIIANSDVHLAAPYVALGKDFVPPVLPENRAGQLPFTNVAPTYGTGRLFVDATNIDLGTLSFQGIGFARLNANNGDLRGNGIVDIAGTIELRAAQVYPTTLNEFSVFAYDSTAGAGTIRIEQAGTRNLPLSAGGTLSLYATNIEQLGTLRAPMGIINLGWDGTGTAPKDLITGTKLTAPVTKNLVLGAGSMTSVSGVDPLIGKGIVVPYGYTDGTSWFDPRGFDITGGGLPQKAINISAGSVSTLKGSTIDLRGGGDLQAVEWKIGNGGPIDILGQPSGAWSATTPYKAGDLITYKGVTYSARVSSQGITPSVSLYWTEVSEGFAVVPGYNAAFAPYSPFASYSDNSLSVGDRIYLGGSKSLAAGVYTLLPARYALLPGGVLVTPKASAAIGTYNLVTGASFVSGYRISGNSDAPTPLSRFEIAPAAVINARASYDSYLATNFLSASAKRLNISTPLLPNDSGYLLLEAGQSMNLQGQVLSQSITSGHGSAIDITAVADFTITGSNASGSSTPGVITLSSSVLDAFGAESLLIGGKRVRSSTATTLTVQATSITVDNAGSTLAAPDLTLASKGDLTLSAGSSIASTGTLTQAEAFKLTGDGTLVRVSQDVDAEVTRSNTGTVATPTLSIGTLASIKGGSITLDSTASSVIDPSATLSASAFAINSGRISIELDIPGNIQNHPGLELTGTVLDGFAHGSHLSLTSYTSIDIYGTGTIGGPSVSSLALNAGQIRGFSQAGGTGEVTISASTLILGNKANAAPVGIAASSTGNLTFNADVIRLTANNLAVDQFSLVTFNATHRIIGEGIGGVAVQNAATLNTPLLTGAGGAKRTFTSGGNLTLSSPGIPTTASAEFLGSSLSLSGANVSINSTISLPSGSLSIRSTSGDLTIGGQLDVGGTSKTFYDVTRYTDAGQITLAADTGNVSVASGSVLNLAAASGGGSAGTLAVSVPNGSFTTDGIILAAGATGGSNGSFKLDTKALPTTSALSTALTQASLTNSQDIRVRTGNVLVDGAALAHDFRLSADLGGITVDGNGSIDASGVTGGTITLASRGDLVLSSGSLLTVHGNTFNSAGKGGTVTLESGTERFGVVGSGVVDVRTGATIDLTVASKVTGDEATVGSSAYQGRYSGTLHIRAPQNAAGTDLLVKAINGTIMDASSIIVEGYKIYDRTTNGGTITSDLQTTIFNDGQSFLGAAGTTTTNYTTIVNRLLANNSGLTSVLVLAPGAEITNRSGDLTLGSLTSDTTSDWNLSTFRFGKKSAPGVLTLRASGDVNLYNALSDGFNPTLASSDPTWLWLARLSTQKTPDPLDPVATILPVNAQSWSFRITAGADLGAADFHQVQAAGAGSFKLGKDGGAMTASGGSSALTSTVISATTTGGGRGLFQVLRTGSGDIDITTKGSVQLANQFASIYTAGTRVKDPTLGGLVDFISLSQVGGSNTLGADQQNYPAFFSVAGGNVGINAGANIERTGASSSREMPNNWLYRRGSVDLSGEFIKTGFSNSIASTAWWVDFSNFFEGVGTLGGGNISLTAGNNVTNVDAVAPTNARTTINVDSTRAADQKILELGGGDVTVKAGNNIDAGVYYVERGKGVLQAGGKITTNSTRSPGLITPSGANAVINENSWLPTTLFVGKGSFDVSAGSDVLLGPVANAFLQPVGLGNSFWNKTYFSTYASDSHVNVTSLGGSLTLRQGSYINNTFMPLLEAWATTQQLLASGTAANSQPWLRLAETLVTPFRTSATLMPSSLRATAYAGDINIVGNFTLSPSTNGTLELLTGGAINALQPVGFNTRSTPGSIAWVASRINLSDASPDSIAGPLSPISYQSLVGTSVGQASSTRADFLSKIDALFDETGATLGARASLQTGQSLHSAELLHQNDTSPLRLYATTGDISGLTLFSPKAVAVHAGRDLSDVSFYIQNLHDSDVSLVTTGRDVLLYNANSLLRLEANRTGNLPIEGYSLAGAGPLAGDLQINGPGLLEVLAGRDIDLGSGTNNADGTGAGITSIGSARNPYLPFQGASILAGSGLGSLYELSTSKLNFDSFIKTTLAGVNGTRYLSEAGATFNGIPVTTLNQLEQLPVEDRDRIALQLFFLALRDAGRDHNLAGSSGFGNYAGGLSAIQSLFGQGSWSGDIRTHERDIRTRSGGDISLFAPGGGVTLAQTISRNALIPPGIITEAGGSINAFTDGNVNLGVSRIFTLRGGDIMIWSTHGNIAAGASSKTVQSAPPTRVLIDPSSGDVTTDLAGLATGGGIGVLATVAGIPPGSVDLIAPNGVIDAGDAGIRSTGNLNIAAVSVLNASNISVGGSSSGTPAAPTVSAPNIGGLSSASSSAGASTSAATNSSSSQQKNDKTQSTQKAPSIISVEVLGYGGDDDSDEDEKKKKKNKH